MKLKQYPSDFIVEEISSIVPSNDKDEHKIFLLEKEGMDAFEALRYISKRWLVPYSAIGYAGLKDKHASTKQWISIPSGYSVSPFRKNRIRTEFIGYCGKRIRIGELIGNRFIITVRDVKKDQFAGVSDRLSKVERYGVLNYFDSQRFGSVIKNHFIAKAILQQNIEEAVKWFLTLYQKSESRVVKEDKRLILRNWNDLGSVSLKNHRLRVLVDEYVSSGSWFAVYQKIPIRLRELFKTAYQSYLWNECIKQVVSTRIEKDTLFEVPYTVGFLLFYSTISHDMLMVMPDVFPTVSSAMELSKDESSVLNVILKKENIGVRDLTRIEETGTFFSTQYRKVIVKPDKFRTSKFDVDELNSKVHNKRYKIELTFELPKGSYATIVTKSIFGH